MTGADAGRFTPDPWRLERPGSAAPESAAVAGPGVVGAGAAEWDVPSAAGGAATATAVRPSAPSVTSAPDAAVVPAPRDVAAGGRRAEEPPAGPGASPRSVGTAPADELSRRRRAGARADGSSARRAPRLAHVPYFLVLAMSVASVAWMWQGGTQRARGGTLAMGGALVAAALARLVLPEGRAGMLASRARIIDVVTLAALAVGLLVAGLMLPTPS